MEGTKNRKNEEAGNYVLVVDYNGEPDIFQFSYDTSWSDVAVVLQVKYECDELPAFCYTDDDDDEIHFSSQEEFEVALLLCKKNDDVLHLKVKPASASQTIPTPRMRPSSISSVEASQSPIGVGLSWASSAVKNAVHGIGQGLISITSNDNSLSMDDMIFKTPNEDMMPNSLTPSVAENQPTPSTSDRQNTVGSHDSMTHDQFMTSSATIVKEPVHVCDEIEVPTSLEDEVSVKTPYSTLTPPSKDEMQSDPHQDVMHTIKQEVRQIVNKEISALREEIQTHLLPQIKKTAVEPNRAESSDDSKQRSPKVIKREIKQLRKEMNEAKLLKRQKKQKHSDKTSGEDATSPKDLTEMRHVRKYAASFICENLLDGSCVGTNQTFTKYWVLKNDGTRTWDHKIKLELLKETPSSDGSSVDPSIEANEPQVSTSINKTWGPEQQKISLPTVRSRETTVIAIRHVAPNHVCSYVSSWRLHHKGQPFGPRIWCNVSVVNHMQIPVVESQPCSTLLTTDEETSFIKEKSNWIPPHRSTSQTDNINQPSLHDDDISNMLSFEMTDIGKNFPQQLPPPVNTSYSEVQSSSLKSNPQQAEEAEPNENGDAAMPEVDSPLSHEGDAEINKDEQPEVKKEEEKVMEEVEEEEEEFESIKDVSHILEDEAVASENNEKRDDVEDRLRDEEFNSSSSSNMEEEDSECMSDFEVIPLPECFDTTRPLSGSEKGDQSNPTSLTLTEKMPETSQDVPVPDNETQAEDEIMEIRERCEMITGENEDEGTDIATADMEVKEVIESSANMPEVAPEEPSQSTSAPTSVNISEVVSVPKSVPQSVLTIDEPCEVPEYSQGYEMPQQQVVNPEAAWVSEPIALPQAVLSADEPWIPPQSASAPAQESSFVLQKVTPVPQPRSSAQKHQTEEIPEPLTSDMIASPQPHQMVDSESSADDDDNPQILYPPMLDHDANNEFTLAPQAPEPASLPHLTVQHYNPSPMEVLIEMGFMDLDLNENVLSACEGDINRAVQSLLSHQIPNRPRSNAHSHQRHSNGGFIA